MSEFWLEILRRQIEEKGQAAVARELNVSSSTVSLVASGNYPASTNNIEEKVINIYGHDGKAACPILGEITPTLCLSCWERAQKIGVKCGNPATIRLYKCCLQCDLRN